MAKFYGSNGVDTINHLDGVTGASDTIYGYGGDDKLFGLGGNDHLKGGGGADDLWGGIGTDTAYYDDSSEAVVVVLGTGPDSGLGFGGTAEGDELYSIENVSGSNYGDSLHGDAKDNALYGLGGHDVLKGGGGADNLSGGKGNDTLMGGEGADDLWGGDGIDTASYAESGTAVFASLVLSLGLDGDAQGDVLNSIENLTGSDYDDRLEGNHQANVLKGLDGADFIEGRGGNDTIEGGAGADILYGDGVGGVGDDVLLGGSGNDQLIGGSGVDTMTGGAGPDTFHFYSMADFTFGTPDLITDFNDLDEAATDKISLSLIDADTTAAGNQAFIWIGNNNDWTNDYGAGQLRFNGGYLEGDVDGDHNADFRIEIDGVPVIHDYAFIL